MKYETYFGCTLHMNIILSNKVQHICLLDELVCRCDN